MIADGILQTTTGTGVAGAAIALSAITLGGIQLPTFASKFTPGANGDAILFAVRRADNPVFQFAAMGHLSDSTTLVIDRVLSTWDGSTADDTNPVSIALASGVSYYVYPTMEAGAMAGLWPGIVGDGSADSQRVLLLGRAGVVNAGSLSALTLTAGTLYAWPAMWPCMRPLKKLFADISTPVASSSVRLGVWAMTASGGRGRLLADSGAMASTVAQMVGASVTEVRPSPFGVWVGLMSDAAIAVRSTGAFEGGALGWGSSVARYVGTTGISARTFSAGLPDPLPDPTTVNTSGTANSIPLVWGGV